MSEEGRLDYVILVMGHSFINKRMMLMVTIDGEE